MNNYLTLTDFGLVILIWMTQLIVYPGFTYYSETELLTWHPKYTTAISLIVMPLMLIQLFGHGYLLWENFNLLELLVILLIVGAWINTFFFAVPLHNQIAAHTNVLQSASKLVQINWYRTIIWTIVFILSLYNSIKSQSL